MFENVLGQAAALSLAADFAAGRLPRSILFAGPPASGKGSAALELARVVSCTGRAAWDCACPDCALHRQLLHSDLLMMGSRSFAGELAASAAAYKREPGSAARTLFLRAVRKLTGRFNAALWEGEETKLNKLAPLLSALDETMDGLERAAPADPAALAKEIDSAVQAAWKLEAEGIADSVSVGQVRRASFWLRLSPAGRRKVLLIEQADRMQDGARNALLKILEEPPETALIILATTRRSSLLPTVQSRLRPYLFAARSAESESQVLRRVFRDPEAAASGMSVAAYLDARLPVSSAGLRTAAAAFAAAAAAAGRLGSDAEARAGIRKAADAALAAGADGAADRKPASAQRGAVARAMAETGKFEPRSQFGRFLAELLVLAAEPLRSGAGGPEAVALAGRWREAVGRADLAVAAFNQAPAAALERLFAELAAPR
jgi:DNA polymerase-3 subunit gamma/tau